MVLASKIISVDFRRTDSYLVPIAHSSRISSVTTMTPLRVCFLLTAMFALASKRVFAFRSKTNVLPTRASGKIGSSLPSSSSSTKDLPSQDPNCYPRAAVSIALRWQSGDFNNSTAHYLLIRRGNEPNKGKWALPGGKLEWGEPTLEGAKRELSEEISFGAKDDASHELVWCPEPYAAVDAIAEGFHYLIAVCFAECKPKPNSDETIDKPPRVLASDDAIDAKWWSVDELDELEQQVLVGTRGLVRRLKRTESLYQKGVLSSDDIEP